MCKALPTTAVPAMAMLPAVVQVNAPVGIRMIVPLAPVIGGCVTIVSIAAVPLIKLIDLVGPIELALAIVLVPPDSAVKVLVVRLVAERAPTTESVARLRVPVNVRSPLNVALAPFQ